MSDGAQEQSGRWRCCVDAAPRLFRCMSVALLFLALPVSLVCGVGFLVSGTLRFFIPTFTVLSVLVLPAVLLSPLHREGRGVAVVSGWLSRYSHMTLIGVTVLIVLSSWIFRTAQTSAVIALLGMFAVPWFYASCPRTLIPRRIPQILGVLWLIQVVHGYMQIGLGLEVVALAGNRNWAATLIIILAPWALLSLEPRARRRTKRNAQHFRILVALAIAGLSLPLVVLCHCRATWLMLAVYAFLFLLLPSCTRLARAVVIGLTAVLLMGVVVVKADRIVDMVTRDIRVPLYASTIRLVRDHPMFGVGAGNFRREFVEYRSLAHKARPNAATVTEHPHNELLHVAAQAGIPVAVIWALLLVPPLFLFRRRSPYWLSVHFTAWMVIGHGMLDKVLVQPPMSILGLVCVGLLWRPMLRLRWASDKRPQFVARALLPAGCALGALFSIFLIVREVRVSAVLRRASQAERAGDYEHAYEAYASACAIDPKAIHPHAYAGICAINKLRDPKRALPHLIDARELESDFAHLNGEIGLTLGTMGRDGEALPFFVREAELFPFSVTAHQRLYVCGTGTGRIADLSRLHQRIGTLLVQRATLTLGEEELQSCARRVALGVRQERIGVALGAASELVSPFTIGGAEPSYSALCAAVGRKPVRFQGRGFSTFDGAYWARMWEWHKIWRMAPPQSAVDVGDAFAGLESVPEGSHARAAELCRFARAAGYDALEICSGALCLVEIRRGSDSALVDAASGRTWRDASLEMLFGEEGGENVPCLLDVAQTRIHVPMHPMQFQMGTQMLGEILARVLGRTVPSFGESPAACMQRARQRCAAIPRLAAPTYDQESFGRWFAECEKLAKELGEKKEAHKPPR